ncbi:MAG: DinB family protein [Thermomicrobiales bacterium]
MARHHAWANAGLIAFCANLDDEAQNTPIPGTYGSIVETLRHLIDAEMSYLFRLTGAWPERPWQDGEPVGFDVLAERAARMADAFFAYLATAIDIERRSEARSDKGEVFSVPTGVFTTQIFHHANLHRGHVGIQLGALGIEAPDFSAWDYAIETGRSTLDRIEIPANQK